MYWSFKNECPTGLVTQETFHGIFSKFFPTGANLSCYSHYIFSAMDQQKTGVLTFEVSCVFNMEYVISLVENDFFLIHWPNLLR